MRSAPSVEPGPHEGRVQSEALTEQVGLPVGDVPALGGEDLLDEPDLAVGGGPEGPQVSRLDTVPGEGRGGTGDREGRLAVVARRVGTDRLTQRRAPAPAGALRRARGTARQSSAPSTSRTVPIPRSSSSKDVDSGDSPIRRPPGSR